MFWAYKIIFLWQPYGKQHPTDMTTSLRTLIKLSVTEPKLFVFVYLAPVELMQHFSRIQQVRGTVCNVKVIWINK